MREHNIKGLEKGKLDNNDLIARFLLLEEQGADMAELEKKASQTACKLEAMAVGLACGTEHVLLINTASLYLYANNLKQYRRIKGIIEVSLACNDVLELRDNRGNDFYRYHFV